jgi:hypothetical protein
MGKDNCGDYTDEVDALRQKIERLENALCDLATNKTCAREVYKSDLKKALEEYGILGR